MKPTVLTRLVRAYEWDAMCAKIEQLRVINADLRLIVDGLESAAHEERAAVVAWLRDQARAQGASPDERTILTWASNRIDRGEHRREEER